MRRGFADGKKRAGSVMEGGVEEDGVGLIFLHEGKRLSLGRTCWPACCRTPHWCSARTQELRSYHAPCAAVSTSSVAVTHDSSITEPPAPPTPPCSPASREHHAPRAHPAVMWLDRFAQHSAQHSPAPSPSPGRSYSPAPSRRPYLAPLPQRPGINPRSSSLSLLSPTSSTSSLPTQVRLPNGSGLRVQINNSPPADVPDPQKVLEDILGGPPKRTSNGPADGAVEKPDEVVADIDFGGLSLHAFAEADADIQPRLVHVHTRSTESIEECTFFSLAALLDANHAHVRALRCSG